ncbi:hypothetical protein ABES58_30090 [Paenibacillus lautus]|uniref:hypothetical protein n=1 Tax=Paenibacillus lautus TaxID=1401 RepID=UPI003D2E76C6
MGWIINNSFWLLWYISIIYNIWTFDKDLRKWYTSLVIILSGPLGVLILSRDAGDSANERELRRFYKKKLKKCRSIECIIENLKNENLSPSNKEILKGLLVLEEKKKRDLFVFNTTSVTLVVTAYVAITIAAAGNDIQIILPSAASILVLIVTYLIILGILSTISYRVTMIKTGFDVYENLTRIS